MTALRPTTPQLYGNSKCLIPLVKPHQGGSRLFDVRAFSAIYSIFARLYLWCEERFRLSADMNN